MATTTKTLAPTNQTITIPDMTERPNASVLTDAISKEADAINALNSNIATSGVTTPTLTNVETGSNAKYWKAGNVVTVYYDITPSIASQQKQIFTLAEDISK